MSHFNPLTHRPRMAAVSFQERPQKLTLQGGGITCDSCVSGFFSVSIYYMSGTCVAYQASGRNYP